MSIPSSTDEMLAGIPKAEQGNLGIIPISAVIMPHFLQLDTYRVDKGRMTWDVAFEDIHKKLQLPQEYTIVAIFFYADQAMWHVMVRSEFLPATPEGHLLPKVIPSYSKNMETGMVAFTGLEIQQAAPPQSVSRCCYLCGGPDEQICIVCERDICQNDVASGIRPGDKVICRECDLITPDRVQAGRHFTLREMIKA